MDVRGSGWNGWKRKKREAKAEPTFLEHPAEPEPSGKGTAKGTWKGSDAWKGTRIGS
jgi:hypothetical protein